MLRNHLRRDEDTVRAEGPLEDSARTLPQETGNRSGGDDLHLGGAVGDHEGRHLPHGHTSERYGQRSGLDEAAQPNSLAGRDGALLRFGGRQVIDRVRREVRRRERAHEHGDAEGRDQYDAARSDPLKHRAREGTTGRRAARPTR